MNKAMVVLVISLLLCVSGCVDTPKVDTPKVDTPKVDDSKPDAPSADAERNSTKNKDAEDKPLLKHYRGKVVIPDELYKTYEQLVAAFKKGDRAAIERICLPEVVGINTGIRPPDLANVGAHLNLYFVRTGFSPQIAGARQYGANVFLLRTATSWLFFVETKSGAWLLYKYFDKGIQ